MSSATRWRAGGGGGGGGGGDSVDVAAPWVLCRQVSSPGCTLQLCILLLVLLMMVASVW